MFTNSRPVLSIPMKKVEKILYVLSVLLLISSYGFIIYVWNDLPNSVPTHFNISGDPDGWGGKGNILILPIIGTFIFILTFVISKFPHVFNYPVEITNDNAEKMYLLSRRMLATLNLVIMLFFAIGTWEMAQVAFGDKGFGVLHLPIFLSGVLGTIGYYLYRMFR